MVGSSQLPPLEAVLENGRRVVEGAFSDMRMEEGVMRGRRGEEDIESFWNLAVKLEIFRGFMVLAWEFPFKTSFEQSLRSSKCVTVFGEVRLR
jgi:hypothetical protein